MKKQFKRSTGDRMAPRNKSVAMPRSDDLSERFGRRCGEYDITSAERAEILRLIGEGVTADVCKALAIVRGRRRS